MPNIPVQAAAEGVPNINRMSIAEIIEHSYNAMALIKLCESTAWVLSESGEDAQLAGSIGSALKLVNTLLSAVHNTLELHEKPIAEALHERA